jgi:DNA modification methylase
MKLQMVRRFQSHSSEKTVKNENSFDLNGDNVAKVHLRETLERTLNFDNLQHLQRDIRALINETGEEPPTTDSTGSDASNIVNPYGYAPLKEDLIQILESRTLERAKYYVRRLLKSLTETQTNSINEINLNRWKEYDDIITDSLWIFDKRDTSGAHLGWYWGNFIPQIPHQFILRFTKRGDWVLDPFAGSGTTLIESIRLGRNAIGVDINQETINKALKLIAKEPHNPGTKSVYVRGDSTKIDFKKLCERNGVKKVQLVLMHPPYFDIIKFSDDPRDLSNAGSIEQFMKMFKLAILNTYDVLQDGRFMVLVAGDKYQDREWIPLGFRMMNAALESGFILIGIIAKNFDDTRGKRSQKELWRYRALAGGFYVFKHEYIFVFKKARKKRDTIH